MPTNPLVLWVERRRRLIFLTSQQALEKQPRLQKFAQNGQRPLPSVDDQWASLGPPLPAPRFSHLPTRNQALSLHCQTLSELGGNVECGSCLSDSHLQAFCVQGCRWPEIFFIPTSPRFWGLRLAYRKDGTFFGMLATLIKWYFGTIILAAETEGGEWASRWLE